jgi:site-specific DNA recombinase
MTTTHREGRKPLRIAAYCRVASRAQADQQAAIEAQQSTISQYIEDRKQHDGWQVESLTFYTDAGESAKNLNRPGVQRLRRDVAEGRLDVVICTKIDRLARNLLDFLELWNYLHRHDVSLVSVQEEQKLARERRSAGAETQ